MVAAFNKAWEKRYRGPSDVDATARDFPGLKYSRARDGWAETATIGCGKALFDLEEKLEGLMPRGGVLTLDKTAPPPPAALR